MTTMEHTFEHTFDWSMKTTITVPEQHTPESTSDVSASSSSEPIPVTLPKTRAPKQQQPQQHRNTFTIGFEFVNVAHPSEARGKASKSTIRSHVARVQHSRVQISGLLSEKAANVKARAKRSNAQRESAAAKEVKRKDSRSTDKSTPSVERKDSRAGDQDSLEAKPESILPIEEADETVGFIRPSKASRAMWINQNKNLILSKILPGGRHDPFWTYPIEYFPFVEEVVDHYLVNIAIEIPAIDLPDEKSILRTRWFPVCMASPPAFYATLLVAATHLVMLNASLANAINLMALKGRAIEAINMALSDPARNTTDETIGAVMKMASYEAMFGDVPTYTAHMSGLRKMVQLRGGLPTLGMDGLMERMLLYVDANAALLTGSDWQFPKQEFPTMMQHPVLDTQPFGTCAHVG